jgi:hypothetical protein
MHWSYMVVHGTPAADVPRIAGVDINWDYGDPRLTKQAALQMMLRYTIKYKPARGVGDPAQVSNHVKGLAIDMTLTWSKPISVVVGPDASVTYKGIVYEPGDLVIVPRGSGATSGLLHQIGATYGVIKLVRDRPHWSFDGH